MKRIEWTLFFPAMSEAVLAAIKRGCFLIALRMRPSGRAVFTTATELLFAKANLPTFPQPFMPRMQKFFRLGCKIVHAKHAYLGYSSIAAGGGCGVNAMFTFTIEGCVVVVNGRFVKEESPSLFFSVFAAADAFCRVRKVSRHTEMHHCQRQLSPRGRDRVYASWWR